MGPWPTQDEIAQWSEAQQRANDYRHEHLIMPASLPVALLVDALLEWARLQEEADQHLCCTTL